jgi:hypothetical protein
VLPNLPAVPDVMPEVITVATCEIAAADEIKAL